ncbi:MAG: hypothetical protein ACRDE7_05570, partial [Sphingobacterium sp.]
LCGMEAKGPTLEWARTIVTAAVNGWDMGGFPLDLELNLKYHSSKEIEDMIVNAVHKELCRVDEDYRNIIKGLIKLNKRS